MRILYLITGLSVGGAENALYSLARNLDKRYEPIVCAAVEDGPLRKKLEQSGLKTIYLGYRPFIDIRAFFRLRKMIRRYKPDILHSFMFHSNMLARFAAIGTGCKVICSIRIREMEKPWHTRLDRLTSFLVDRYTANSESIRKHLHGFKDVQVIPNSVDPGRFDVKASKELQSPAALMVANLRKQKDHITAVRAFSKVDANLYIAGGYTRFESEKEKIENEIEKLGLQKRVKLLGHREDVPSLLKAADIWLSTTLYEGQSNSLLEAMAAGVPIVTTDIPENREVVEDGKDALLVPARDPEKTADALNKLLEDTKLAKSLSDSAYRKAILRTPKKMAKRYQELYDSL